MKRSGYISVNARKRAKNSQTIEDKISRNCCDPVQQGEGHEAGDAHEQ
jgi:hypothetical protein